MITLVEEHLRAQRSYACPSMPSNSGMTRRTFLGSASIAAMAVGTPIALLGSTKPAKAFWVAAALAVGSLVAGAIAAHNRRDVTSLLLIDIRERLNVITNQLASLQTATALVLE